MQRSGCQEIKNIETDQLDQRRRSGLKGPRVPSVCSNLGKEQHWKNTVHRSGYYIWYISTVSLSASQCYIWHVVHEAYLEGMSVHLLLKHLILVKQSMKRNKWLHGRPQIGDFLNISKYDSSNGSLLRIKMSSTDGIMCGSQIADRRSGDWAWDG